MSLLIQLLRRPVYVVALWLIIGTLGLRSYVLMPVDLFPDTVPPQIVVMTVVRGAAAEDVNRQVSSLIDRELKGLTGLSRVTATSRDEISSVNAEFAYERDIGAAMNDVINAVTRIKGQFPVGSQEPQIFRITDANRPLMTLSVTPKPGSGLDLKSVRLLAENDLKEELLALPGVGKVDVFGANQAEVLIRLDHDKLRRYSLSPESVLSALGAGNLSLPGGYQQSGGRESLVKTLQEARTPAELAALPVRVRGGGVLTIGDVASISLAAQEPRSFYHGNASPAIALNVLKPEGGNSLTGILAVKKRIPHFEGMYPGLLFAVTTDQQPIIDINIAGMKDALQSAILLTMLIVFLFLVDLKSSLIIGISIPMSFLSAFAYLYYTPFTINMVTLSGLIISVGMVVDASIVVVENVERHISAGGTVEEGVVRGTREVAFSILGGMLTTIVVLIPIMFVGGYPQQVLRPLTMTITATLAGSFLAAVTIVPLLLKRLFRSGSAQPAPGSLRGRLLGFVDSILGMIAEFYLVLLRLVLKAPLVTLTLMLAALVATAGISLPLVGRELMPRMDTGMITVRVDLPPSMPHAEAETVISTFESIMRAEPHVLAISSVAGAEPGQVSFGAGGLLLQQAEMQVRLTTRDRRNTTIWEIMNGWRSRFAKIPGPTAFSVTEFGATPMSTTRAPLDVQITGRDPKNLAALAETTRSALMGIPGLRDVRTSWSITKPETHFTPDPGIAMRYGLTARAIGEMLGVTFTGRIPTRLKMTGYLDLPVRIDIGRAGNRWEWAIGDLVLPLPVGDLFLSTLGVARAAQAPTMLTRENLRQSIDILAANDGRPLSSVAADVQTVLDGIDKPAGYDVRLIGTMSDMADTGRRLGGALGIGLVFLYIVLWVLFENWWRPFLVMVSIPLSLIGALWGLVFFAKPMCMPAMMGLILLGGTIVNNAIILIDFIDQARAGGISRREALFEAVRIRLRPILITTGSTVLGLLPLVLEQAVGLERMSPLGIVAAFGLTFGTFLTLVLIPALYDRMSGWEDALAASSQSPAQKLAS